MILKQKFIVRNGIAKVDHVSLLVCLGFMAYQPK